MKESYVNSAALVVLPARVDDRLQSRSLRTWLARADLSVLPRGELLAGIVAELGLPYPGEGLAALRMWGQTGERPTVWIAGADPVYLEPRLDQLCLHDLADVGIASSEFRSLFEHLQNTLAGQQRFGFIRLGQHGYLRARNPMTTAEVPPYVVNQQVPSHFLPAGEGAGAYRTLLSEIEMSLHDHAVNQQRASAGRPPVNSLWIWGGGTAPERTERPQPPLFSNDPVLLGYWDSASASARLWPGSIADCLAENRAGGQGSGFVAVPPADEPASGFLEHCLAELRAALQKKHLDRVTILFRDGLRADIVRSQRLKFWRRDSPLLYQP